MSEKAKAIIEKFEEKLYAGKYTAEQKNGIRAELVWQLLAKHYPETVCKVEETMAAAESEKHNVESPLKGLEGLVSQFGDSLALAMGLIDLHTIRLQIPICDLVDDEQIEVLSKETPAIVDHYFYVIVKYVVFKDSNDIYPDLCINLSSEVRTIRVLFIKDSIDLEENLRSSQYPLYWILWFFKFKNSNSIFSVSNNKFDLIIIDENEDISKDSTFRYNGITCFLQEIVSKHLSDTGNLFYRSSAESINDDSLQAFRKWIVENKLLHGVIQLSEGQILVISKQPANSIFFFDARKDVHFVDAPKDFVKDDKLDVDKLIEAIREKTSVYYIDVPFADFVSHNSKYYTFIDRADAQRFVPTPKEGEVLVALKDLIDLYESETEDYISCYFLNRAYYFKTDCWDNLEAVEMPRARRVPNEKYFLFRWDEFAGVFSCAYQNPIYDDDYICDSSTGVSRPYDYCNHHPIVCTYPNSIVFKLKENPAFPIDPYYLAKLLAWPGDDVYSEVYAQLACYKLPFIDRTLEKEDFLSIVIAIPPMEEQLRILNLDRQKALANTKEEIKKNFESYRQDIRMKKHALTQRLATMDNWWKILLKAREDGNGIVDDKATVGSKHPVQVRNIYTQIDQEMKMLFEQLKTFTLGDAMDREEIFDATAFVRGYIKKHYDPMFEYQLQPEELLDGPAYIRFPKKAFQIILDNIRSNACSHGFKGNETGENIIRVMMEIKGNDLIVHVSNNGKPMPVKMTADKVFTYGYTTEEGIGEHSGLGGYQIKDLMTKFGGEVELLLDAEAEFPVTYKLIFRDVNIYKRHEYERQSLLQGSFS